MSKELGSVSMASGSVTSANRWPVNKNLIVGMDAGGTKVHIADTLKAAIRRYDTAKYANLDEILQEYFQTMQARPARIMVGMAGPRDDETGEIKFTNLDWPAFNPREAGEHYGIIVDTANDMVVTMAGVLQETGIDLLTLKPGIPTRTGAKLVVTLSTGIGTAAAVWDNHSKRYVIAAGEGGHIGFQSKNEREHAYAAHLHQKYPHASIELALSGKHGVDNIVEHMLEATKTPHLADAIERARQADRPVGAVLLEFATEGTGADRHTAQDILKTLGDILGSALRDLAVVTRATGGIYLTGSMALGLSEYFAAQTDFCKRFVRDGAVHDAWLEKLPIYLVSDPNIAVRGALALAKDSAA